MGIFLGDLTEKKALALLTNVLLRSSDFLRKSTKEKTPQEVTFFLW